MSGKNTKKQLSMAFCTLRACLIPGLVVMSVQMADAQTRRQPDTTKLTCSQTQELVAKFGAINLKSGPYKFDRYVTNRNKCYANESVRTTYVPTLDTPRCSVQVCVERDRNRR